jgi:hypothetical protein
MLSNQFYFNASIISHDCFCTHRVKLESFGNLAKIPNSNNYSAIAQGNKLHAEYNSIRVDFDTERVKKGLEQWIVKSKHGRDVFTKSTGNTTIVGMYDKLKVIQEDGKKYTALIELKTTNKPYMWSREVLSAIKQLELYQWLLKENLEILEYPLYKHSFVEIYSQSTGYLIKRIEVPYNDNIEEWITHVVNKLLGLERQEIVPYKYCLMCPRQVKSACSFYALRSKKDA